MEAKYSWTINKQINITWPEHTKIMIDRDECVCFVLCSIFFLLITNVKINNKEGNLLKSKYSIYVIIIFNFCRALKKTHKQSALHICTVYINTTTCNDSVVYIQCRVCFFLLEIIMWLNIIEYANGIGFIKYAHKLNCGGEDIS